jgi:23S rRNA U2552 (ribose-2'-O)-methylase RlmE/FtsJ
METLFSEKPPWKSVEWVRTPIWTNTHVTYSTWSQVINQETLAAKERIGVLDREHKWELAKKMVNPYELIYTHGDTRLPPALSLTQPLSRSYFKMIEILDVLQTFQRTSKSSLKLRTAHVAEGPGGFIQAVYDSAEHYKRVIATSTAMTLKPTTAHVPGWKKAAAFLMKYKQVKIVYGADGTGTIYKPENQAFFTSAVRPGVHLFTADGGFDFSIDYTQQEQKVFHLLLCSISIGLQALRTDGDFVLKLFDMESPHTRFLVLFLGRHFDEWTLYKPAMTRPCNSERYFLGRGFRGIHPTTCTFLAEMQEKSLEGLYPKEDAALWAPKECDFLERHIQITTRLQIQSITLAIELSMNSTLWFRDWYTRCLEKSYAWCEAFRVPAKPKHTLAQKLLI